MRELKFRAVTKMEDGSIRIDYGGFSIHATAGNILTDCEPYIKKDSIIEQFTGLLDKNGVEIYEGDIVKCNNDHIGAIEWEKNDCCFNVTEYYSTSDDYPTMAFMEGPPFEVIGNIHKEN